MSASEKMFPQYGPLCGCCAPVPWWSPPEATEAAKDGPRRDAPRLLNSFTKTKVPFVPLDGNRVGWYICGPTVYDSAHMGHARNYVNFDVIRRVMTDYFRYDVRFIMNVTDIDDKIVMRAHLRRSEAMLAAADHIGGIDTSLTAPLKALLASGEKNLGDQEALTAQLCAAILAKDPSAITDPDWSVQDGYLTLAHTFEAEFMEDMRLMGVARPDALTRVSEYTDKIVQYIQTIIDRGYAYESNGSVYFDVPTFESAPNHKYAKLNKEALKNVELAMDGEGALAADASEKKAENDFVLWKASKPGEPRWPSPWGEGRPGWHIECSAMCSDILGEAVDINGGGIDLNFPHHENQLAQSEAHYDIKQWVNYFVHTGHLHIDGLKMSKSLKNFITIRAALKMYTARQIRFLFLLHQWSDPMDLTPGAGGRRRHRLPADGSGGHRREDVCRIFSLRQRCASRARMRRRVQRAPGAHVERRGARVVRVHRQRPRGSTRRHARQHQHPGRDQIAQGTHRRGEQVPRRRRCSRDSALCF
jgi:cysteinyl-tRNA synthetase